MEQLTTYLEDPIYIYAAVAVIILILAIIIHLTIKSNKLKRLKLNFEESLVTYNSLKTIPLTFKMNKAVAIAKVNEESDKILSNCKDDYEKIQSNNEELARLMVSVEDAIASKKVKIIKLCLEDFDVCLEISTEQIKRLDHKLDQILEQENKQRYQVTEFKEKFRVLKANFNENSNAYSISIKGVNEKTITIEKLFSIFEEWMYASEFSKTSEVLEEIRKSITDLSLIIENLPMLIKAIKISLPSMVEEARREYAICSQKNVYLLHINFNSEMNNITDKMKASLSKVEKADITGVKEELIQIEELIYQLRKSLDTEEKAFYKVKQFLKAANEIEKLGTLINYIDELYPKVETKYGLDVLKKDIEMNKVKYFELKNANQLITDNIENLMKPATELLKDVEQLVDDLNKLGGFIQGLKDKLDQAFADEERAKQQILKLQLIVNEMEVKIVKNKLPSISSSFHEDIKIAKSMNNEIKALLVVEPLNIRQLNYKLNDAIDYIYKLYNKVNRVVGMAIMVENTIVFANKYRSSYPDVDSELTRAELCYRNGEYTQALEIAIATVEKIVPNSFGELIKEKALV